MQSTNLVFGYCLKLELLEFEKIYESDYQNSQQPNFIFKYSEDLNLFIRDRENTYSDSIFFQLMPETKLSIYNSKPALSINDLFNGIEDSDSSGSSESLNSNSTSSESSYFTEKKQICSLNTLNSDCLYKLRSPRTRFWENYDLLKKQRNSEFYKLITRKLKSIGSYYFSDQNPSSLQNLKDEFPEFILKFMVH
jgi:hypothetical protein